MCKERISFQDTRYYKPKQINSLMLFTSSHGNYVRIRIRACWHDCVSRCSFIKGQFHASVLYVQELYRQF